LNPWDPSDASRDSDGDGLSNLEEYLAGKNPTLFDNLHFTECAYLPDGRFRMLVWGEPGKTYVLEASTNLPGWQPALLFTCTNKITVVIDPKASQDRQKFYRVAPLSALPKPVLRFAPSAPITSGSVHLGLEAIPGFRYRIETSTNLVTWTTLTNLNATNVLVNFTDTRPADAARSFYRAAVE
jgi:hypothetical protein